jgi:Coenzyme PQQ synthesis protein D (PqqD)
MADLDQSVRPSPDVHSTIVDGEAVLLDLRTEEFIGLNETATRMWECLVDGRTLAEVARCIEEEYCLEPTQARADVFDFVHTMIERQILEQC